MKRYSTKVVAIVLGRDRGTISSWLHKEGKSEKTGMTLEDILKFGPRTRRSSKNKKLTEQELKDVEELRGILAIVCPEALPETTETITQISMRFADDTGGETTRLNIAFSESNHDYIKAISRLRNITASELVNEAVSMYKSEISNSQEYVNVLRLREQLNAREEGER